MVRKSKAVAAFTEEISMCMQECFEPDWYQKIDECIRRNAKAIQSSRLTSEVMETIMFSDRIVLSDYLIRWIDLLLTEEVELRTARIRSWFIEFEPAPNKYTMLARMLFNDAFNAKVVYERFMDSKFVSPWENALYLAHTVEQLLNRNHFAADTFMWLMKQPYAPLCTRRAFEMACQILRTMDEPHEHMMQTVVALSNCAGLVDSVMNAYRLQQLVKTSENTLIIESGLTVLLGEVAFTRFYRSHVSKMFDTIYEELYAYASCEPSRP